MSSNLEQQRRLGQTGYALIDALLETGHVDQARVHLEQLSPEDRAAHRGLELESRILWLESNLDRLEAHLDLAEASLAESNKLWFVEMYRARIRAKRGSIRDGIERLIGFLLAHDGQLLAREEIDSHIWLGDSWFRLREIGAARSHYSKALRLSEGSNNTRGVAVALGSLGRCDRVDGRWDRAIALSEHAIRIFEQSGDLRGVSVECGQLGALRLFRGFFATAANNLDRALTLGLETGDSNVPIYLSAIGLLHVRTGRIDAEAHLLRAFRTARKSQSTRCYALTCEYLGEWSLGQRRWKSASLWLHRAIQLSGPAGFRDIVGEATYRLAELDLALRKPVDALRRVEVCITDFESMSDVYELAVCRRVRGQALLALGRVREAQEDFEKGLEFLNSVGETFESSRILKLKDAAERGDIIWDIRTSSRRSRDEEGLGTGPSLNRNDEEFVTPEPANSRRGTSKSFRSIHHPDFPRILGTSSVMLETLELIKRSAPSRSPVLIEGETGTGKELLARAIHDLSPRAARPFIPFNCGTSTPEVFDAEICGHVRGAFTGAQSARAGLARAAEGGTLFLDEIAELTQAIQPRLLRLLDVGEVRPVGSDEVLQADIRVVAATHQDMDRAVHSKRFRADLFYRLCTFRVRVPALRERLDDLPLLIDYFVKDARANGYPNFAGVSTTIVGKMARYGWPGNIRELRNEVIRLAQKSTPGEKSKTWLSPETPVSGDSGEPIATYIWERDQVVKELKLAKGSVAKVARRLGISRARIYRLISHWEIDLDSFRH